METATKTAITIEATVNAPIEKVWKYWTEAEHVKNWNTASPDWHCPKAENDLRVGGNFSFTMAAKDGSFSFDFGGVYDEVKTNQKIAYTLGDGRKVDTIFTDNGNETKIVSTFEAENQNPVEMQKNGWQAILNNFKKYTEES
ncbi:SRPBCC family protein [Ferruginibacter albus]|uniref:SRPBCC family protein n=1 Tax=Ferruginibacter albus TaxID=2875540 RepID=UPI001CC46B1C|nr:SRPBCC family protein [Ferruginibacter albus]UAY51515.1 SRPBCC family protein [Ferruginibacter albus]